MRDRMPRRLAGFTLALALVAGTGCDSVLGTEEDTSIEGTWRFDGDGFTTFIEISPSTVRVYDGALDECFVVLQFNISSNGEDRYTLTEPGTGFSFTLTIRREGDDLRLIDPENSNVEGDLYRSSEQDLAQMEECTPSQGWGGTDPDIDCSALPQITLGQPVDGALASGDSEFTFEDAGGEFWYYDLFGLTLTASQAVAIGLTATEFDTYLYLYEADGTYIDENDDAEGGTLNSALSASLDSGCYRIEVTSFWPVASDGSGQGAYTLTVD